MPLEDVVCTLYVMSGIRFTWDPEKAAANEAKHGIAFDEAVTAFEDENARIIDDPDHSDSEDRFILLGFSTEARLIVVCHCYRDSAAEIRMISARRATRVERSAYARGASHETGV